MAVKRRPGDRRPRPGAGVRGGWLGRVGLAVVLLLLMDGLAAQTGTAGEWRRMAGAPAARIVSAERSEAQAGPVGSALRGLGQKAARRRGGVVDLGKPKDAEPPTIRVLSPQTSVIRKGPTPSILVEYFDEVSGVDPGSLRVFLDGSDRTPFCLIQNDAAKCPMPPLSGGEHRIEAWIDDLFGNRGSTEFVFLVDRLPLEIFIASPADGLVTAASEVEVLGTVSAEAATVEVAGVEASLSKGTFSAVVGLVEGNNVIVASAADGTGNMGMATIVVTRDTTPPIVLVETPADGETLGAASVNVAGSVNDIVVGTVNEGQVTVSVNGVEAEVANRSFLARDVPLAPGLNTLTAVGVDQVGNSASSSVNVLFETSSGSPRIGAASGDGQGAVVGEDLAQPLVAQLEDENGAPVAARMVVFKVTRNNGLLSAGGGEARSVAVSTDAAGRATVQWRLGTRAGVGNQRVEATAMGFSGTARFSANGFASAPSKLSVDSGLNQSGLVNRDLAFPFVVVVTDAGHNRLAGVPVTFAVTAGGGALDGEGLKTVPTDDQGVARAVLTLGPEEGIENNLVEVDFSGNPGLPATFSASARPAGDPAATKLSGVVLDNTDRPIAGVTLVLDPGGAVTQSDQQGQFTFFFAPVGLVRLTADGSTAQRPGSWPTLQYRLVTSAGRDNRMARPVYLLPLDLPNSLQVDETRGGEINLPGVPGFALSIEPGSATFPDGSRSGLVSVTAVHSDKVPRIPNFGQQPRLLVTIQPSGVRFDPPAALTLPNVDGLAPGQVTELYSFDHDLGQFIGIGTGSVSDDGTVVRSDPGVGIIEGGWHCGGDPASAGSSGGLDLFTAEEEIVQSAGDEFEVEASGQPSLDGRYSWELVETEEDDDIEAVQLLLQPACPDEAVCTARLMAVRPGRVTLRIHFMCTTTGQEVTRDVRLTVTGELIVKQDGRIILENEIAFISATPEMPNLTARLAEGTDKMTVSWRLEVAYVQGNRDDHCYYPPSGGTTDLAGDRTWMLRDEFGDEFHGGMGTITYQIDGGDERTFEFRLWGKNAQQRVVREHLPMLRHQLIAWREARFQQFQTLSGFVREFNEGPLSVLHAGDDGFGIMQLTSGFIPVEQLWKWTANVAEGVRRADSFTANAGTYNDQVQNGENWTSETGGTPPNEGTAFADAPEFTADQLDRETWARYNSGFRYHDWDQQMMVWKSRNDQAPGNMYANDLATRRDSILDDGVYPPLWGEN